MATSDMFASCHTDAQVHNKLMTSLCCDFLEEDTCKDRFRKFKSKCRLYLTTPREKSLSTAQSIWDCLESKGKLGVGNYGTLRELTSDVDVEITYIIDAAMNKIDQQEGKRKSKRLKLDGSVNVSGSLDTNIEHLKETLLKINSFIVKKNQISPLQKRGKDICVDHLYVPVTIKEDTGYNYNSKYGSPQEKDEETKGKIISELKDMLYKNCDPVRYIFMHGEAARGKTFYCKQLLKYWCNAKLNGPSRDGLSDNEKVLGEFDFTFLVSLRHVHQSRTLLEDMICYDTFKNNKECHDTIRHVLSSDQYRCLILVDGLDEWRISKNKSLELTHDGLPNIEAFSACTCFFTLRPSRLDYVASAIYDCDKVVEILGLDEKGQNLVIDKIFIHNYGLKPESKEFKEAKCHISKKIRTLKLKSILEVPLLATTSTMLWYEGKEVGDSVTFFYLALIQLLIRRSFEQQDFNDIDLYALTNHRHPGLHRLNVLNVPRFKTVREFSRVLSLLGEIAYKDLISDETHLVFEKAELYDKLTKDELNFALKVGLLSKSEAPGCFDEENVSLNFFHKSIQEFLASFYVSTTCDLKLLCTKLSDVESILDLSNIFVFTSGLSSSLASELSEHIVRIASNDRKIRLARETFNGKKERASNLQSLFLLQVRCYQEMKYGNISSCDSTFQPITFHVGDIYLMPGDDSAIVKETVEIMKHHYSSVVSLYLWHVPSTGEHCIRDEFLNKFLKNASSLQYIFVRGASVIYHINDAIRLKSLHLFSVRLSQEVLRGLHKSILSNKELKALTLKWMKCTTSDSKENNSSYSLMDIISCLPQCPHLYMLTVNYSTLDSVYSMRILFPPLLSHLTNLREMYYGGLTFFDIFLDHCPDAAILDTISRLPNLECIRLYEVNVNYYAMQLTMTSPSLQYLELDHVCLGDTSLEISSNLSKLNYISLTDVNMSAQNWKIFTSSLKRLNHDFDIYIARANIDERTLGILRDSSHFLEVKKTYFCDLHFRRSPMRDQESCCDTK